MTQRIHHATPAALARKGITTVTEIVPVAGDFQVKDAGKTLALLFREELMRLAAARARAASKEGVQ